jgi:hypothetical protein
MTWNNRKGRGTKYGSEHQKARKAYAARHHPWHPCTRCGRPLGPMSPALHLDHDEHGAYRGFSHGRCNVSAGSRKGARIRNAGTTPPRTTQGATQLDW